MAAQHPIITSNSGDLNSSLLAAIVERTAYVLKRTEVLSDLIQDTGMVARVVHSELNGYAYYLNEADTTSPDDGVNVLVDGDGRRYIVANGVDLNVSSVLAIQATPPGSPTDGDAYIVAASPTGAWAGHAEDIAIYTPRGWLFGRAAIGLTVLNQDDGLNWQYDATGTWVTLSVPPADDSVHPAQLIFPMGVAVEAQQNAPGSLTIGIAYLVGTSGSGAWSGHNNDLAFTRDGATWEFIDPYEGAKVYNKATDTSLLFDGSAWVGETFSNIQQFDTPGGATWTKPSRGVMAYIQVWGAGGSGARAQGTGGGGGGGGGSYVEMWVPLSTLAATVAVTVGTGGPARTSQQDGAAGGNSSFGSLLTAYGGGGGDQNGTTESGGGGGAGTAAAGAAGSAAGGAGGAGWNGHADYTGGAGGPAGTGTAGGNSVFGGGGGGGASEGTSAGVGGNSIWGGAGGGSVRSDGSATAGGTSIYGGNGGAGGTGANNAVDGAQPGGGGGGTESGNSGAGGNGRVRVTVF